MTRATNWVKLKHTGVMFRLLIASRNWEEHQPFSFLVMIPIFNGIPFALFTFLGLLNCAVKGKTLNEGLVCLCACVRLPL